MCDENKNKVSTIKLRLASVSESELLRIQDAVPESTQKAMKFG